MRTVAPTTIAAALLTALAITGCEPPLTTGMPVFPPHDVLTTYPGLELNYRVAHTVTPDGDLRVTLAVEGADPVATVTIRSTGSIRVGATGDSGVAGLRAADLETTRTIAWSGIVKAPEGAAQLDCVFVDESLVLINWPGGVAAVAPAQQPDDNGVITLTDGQLIVTLGE